MKNSQKKIINGLILRIVIYATYTRYVIRYVYTIRV